MLLLFNLKNIRLGDIWDIWLLATLVYLWKFGYYFKNAENSGKWEKYKIKGNKLEIMIWKYLRLFVIFGKGK